MSAFIKGYCERGNLCGFAHGELITPILLHDSNERSQNIGEFNSDDDEYNVSENYIFVKNKRMDPGKT